MLKMFDFECEDCQLVFEKLVKDETRVMQCIECPGNANRLIASPTPIFKGSGFYTTDIKRKEDFQKQQRKTGSTQSKQKWR